MPPPSKPHGYIVMGAGLDTLCAENAIAIAVHALSLELKGGAAVVTLVPFETILCLALPANLGIFPPNLKGGKHRGHADKCREGALIAAKRPSFIQESHP